MTRNEKHIFLVMSSSVEIFLLGDLWSSGATSDQNPIRSVYSLQLADYMPESKRPRALNATFHQPATTGTDALLFTCRSYDGILLVSISRVDNGEGETPFALTYRRLQLPAQDREVIVNIGIGKSFGKYLWLRRVVKSVHADWSLDFSTPHLVLTNIPTFLNDLPMDQIFLRAPLGIPLLTLTTCLEFDDDTGFFAVGNSLGETYFRHLQVTTCTDCATSKQGARPPISTLSNHLLGCEATELKKVCEHKFSIYSPV